ncbi:GvpL/GvpF family gas vesicle protein [Haloferacaceae archaeon DSL9]
MSSNVYAYGVIEAEDIELDRTGVEGASPITTVQYRSLAAVVSDIDTMEPEQTDDNSRLHDEVLRDVMLYGDGRPVVPMRFGMTFKNARTLKSVLRGGGHAIRRALNNIDGKMELGVRLVADEDADIDRQAVRNDVHDRLMTVAEDVTENDLFSDRLVLNTSYLVDRDDEDAFGELVAELREEYDDLTFQYTGPWAPYNFVDIEIGTQQ